MMPPLVKEQAPVPRNLAKTLGFSRPFDEDYSLVDKRIKEHGKRIENTT
jgi:hypothetical protein